MLTVLLLFKLLLILVELVSLEIHLFEQISRKTGDNKNYMYNNMFGKYILEKSSKIFL